MIIKIISINVPIKIYIKYNQRKSISKNIKKIIKTCIYKLIISQLNLSNKVFAD